MDITKLTQNLIKGLEQKNTEQLVTLSRLLNIALGKIVLASVTETAPITPEEREALLTKTLEALVQINKLASSATPLSAAIEAEISQLLEQQTLIKSPELKWVSLLVNNRSLLTYTDKPLTANQTIPVQLVNPQKLVFLDLPDTNKIPSQKTAHALTPEILTYKTDTDELKTNNSAQQLQQVLAKTLRQLLPYKDTPTVLYAALNQWQNIPKVNQQQLVSPTLEHALKRVAEHIRSPLQLSQPKMLAQIIKNSGLFFENKLNTPTLTNNQTTVNRTYTQDLKGALLNAVSKIHQELTGNNKPLNTEQTEKLLQQVLSTIPTAATALTTTTAVATQKNNLPLDINLLMQQLMTKPAQELSDKELRSHLLVLLQQHSLHSLAKIQLQQLTSINHEVETKDSKQPNALWQIEIPVKQHNDIQQLHLRIEREWIDEQHSNQNTKTATKIKQWSVTLRFDLPTLGEFCAQLAIVDVSVSATLWAAQEKTLQHVKQKMHDLQKNLEREGIVVKQLQCLKGMPPQKPIALSYSLIDITT